MSLMVCPSTPAAPAFALTSRHALRRMSSRYTLSKSAWNRRVALAFAARYSARWSSRVLSRVCLASPASPTLPPVGHADRVRLLPSAVVLLPRPHQYYEPLRLPLRSPPLHGRPAYRARRSPSTSRSAPARSHGRGGDGPLLFPRRLCQRSAPSTP